MDYMDIDQTCDVPDTPDRLAAQNSSGRDRMLKEGDSSVASHSRNTLLVNQDARNQLRLRSKLVGDNGHSRRLSFRSGKNLSISNKSGGDIDITISQGNSSSAKTSNLFRRTVTDKTTVHEDKYSFHSQCPDKGKSTWTPQSSNYRQNSVVDLTEQRVPTQILQMAVPNRASQDHYAKEVRQGAVSTSGFSSLHGMENPSALDRNAYKGKEKIEDTCKEISGIDCGEGDSIDEQLGGGKRMSGSLQAIPLPRVSGQKRLVRNGCISPHNIAKAKQVTENQSNSSVDGQNDKVTEDADSSLSLIKDLIVEDSNSHRGQRVISHVYSPKEAHPKMLGFSSRHSIAHNEETSGTSQASGDAFRCFDRLGAWRSTRNRTKKVDFPLAGEDRHSSRTDNMGFVNQQNGNSVMIRDTGDGRSNWIGDDSREECKTVSFQQESAPTVSQVASHPMPQSDRVSRRRNASNTLIKRQKQGYASSIHGESSTSNAPDLELEFLGSSRRLSNSRSTANHNSRDLRILDPVVEIDEFSPETRRGLSHNVVGGSNDDSDARARQLEADEMLARELQEQLYNEGLGVGDGETDMHIALAFQQEETSQHALSRRSHPIFHPRGSAISNFYRQFQSRSSQSPSVRRGAQARGPSSGRLTRIRSRLPTVSSGVSHGVRSSFFSPNVDLDMRMDILEALEAFNDMGMDGNFLQVDREFNENDYEMLLALDENNHQHGGASVDQINSLPQSTVQGDNFDEGCAICLDTPTSGETIRHLPCLHKFHKDCIDPWLRRKTSCPVCKSSIT